MNFKPLAYFFTSLVFSNIFLSACFSQGSADTACNHPQYDKNGYYSVALYRFDPYTYLTVMLDHARLKKVEDNCQQIFTYLFDNNFYDDLPDTLQIVVDKCDTQKSVYKYIDVEVADKRIITSKTISEGSLNLIDSIITSVGSNYYHLYKYLISTNDAQKITLYYSDTLGIIKQYRIEKNQDMELDGYPHCYDEILVNAFLKTLYENPYFHERYDGGARAIRYYVIDKDIVKAKKKADKKAKRKSNY